MPVTVLKQYIILNPRIKYAKWAITFLTISVYESMQFL
jgi:hypothetical protein